MTIATHVQSLLKDTASKIEHVASIALANGEYGEFLKSLKLYDRFAKALLKEYQDLGFGNGPFLPSDSAKQKTIEEIFRAIETCRLPPRMTIKTEPVLFYGGFGNVGTAEFPLEYMCDGTLRVNEFLERNAVNYPLRVGVHRLYEFDNSYFYTDIDIVGHPLFTKWTKFPNKWKKS